MNNRKSQNSILVLATLGVYLGLVLAGATIHVLAQEAPESAIKINKKSLSDFSKSLKEKIENKEIDMSSQFSVKYDLFITKTGMLDPKRSKVIESEGDIKLAEIAGNGIEAICASGYMQYLQGLGVEKATIAISQDNQNVSINIVSVTDTKQRARTLTSALNTMFQIAQMQTKNDDEKLLLGNTKATSNESAFAINLIVSSLKFKEMILRKIAVPE